MKYCKELWNVIGIYLKSFFKLRNISIFLLTIALLVLYLIYNTGFYQDEIYRLDNRVNEFEEYSISTYTIVSFLILSVSLFLPFMHKIDEDMFYIGYYKKRKIIIGKIIAYLLLDTYFFLIVFLLINIIGLIFLPYYCFNIKIQKMYYNLFLSSIVIMNISFLLHQLNQSIFISLILNVLLFFVKITNDSYIDKSNNIIINIFQVIIPIPLSKGIEFNEYIETFFMYSPFEYLYIIGLIILSIVVYEGKDLT